MTAGSSTASGRDLAAISHDVLLAAAAVAPASDSERTADLLYHGNWLPLSPRWLARFPDDAAVSRFATGGGESGRRLASAWMRTEDRHWVYWHTARTGTLELTGFKAYVSVLPESLPEAFGRAVEVFGDCGNTSFKLARRPRALLRPDRLVAYCDRRDELERLVERLAAALAALPGQGVPFTSAPAANPAVSWARDPPAPAAGYGGSWRRWVTRKLAAYLHASDAPTAEGRAEFALARLRDDGVDTQAWAPGPGLWGAA